MISTISRCRMPSTLSPFTPVMVSPRAQGVNTGSGVLSPLLGSPQLPQDVLTSLEPRGLGRAPVVHSAHEGEHLHAVPVLVVQPVSLEWGGGLVRDTGTPPGAPPAAATEWGSSCSVYLVLGEVGQPRSPWERGLALTAAAQGSSLAAPTGTAGGGSVTRHLCHR